MHVVKETVKIGLFQPKTGVFGLLFGENHIIIGLILSNGRTDGGHT